MNRIERNDFLTLLDTMRTQNDRTQFTISGHTLKIILVLMLQRITELTEQMPQKRRVRNHSDALLRPRIQPLEELNRTITTILIGLTRIAKKHVLIVNHLRKIKIGKLRRDLLNRSPPVANVPPVPLPALLAHNDARCGNGDARVVLHRSQRCLPVVEEGGCTGLSTASEDVACGLAGSGEG